MNDSVLRKLLGLPEGTPIRKPRFGKSGPPIQADIPAESQTFATTETRERFELRCRKDDLGLNVLVTQEDAGKVVCIVDCKDPNRLGQEVLVTLFGETDGQMRTWRVPLKDREEAGCSGSLTLGTLRELRERLGARSDLEVALLVAE